jgi:flagellar biosynthesis GTPase FlhF
MRAADLRRVAERYSVFQPRNLLFTRLDETETLGPILSLSVRMGKPNRPQQNSCWIGYWAGLR